MNRTRRGFFAALVGIASAGAIATVADDDTATTNDPALDAPYHRYVNMGITPICPSCGLHVVLEHHPLVPRSNPNVLMIAKCPEPWGCGWTGWAPKSMPVGLYR